MPEEFAMPHQRHIYSTYRMTILLIVALVLAIPTMPGTAAASKTEAVGGTVIKTMNAADYTYMLVKTAGRNTWVAMPATQVEVGDEVSYLPGMVMQNFTSTTLDRTFASIVFSPGMAEAGASPKRTGIKDEGAPSSFSDALKKEAQQPAQNVAVSQGSGGSSGAIVPSVSANVAKASGKNSYTIGEIFAQAKELDGTSVRVRGKVVKVSPQIMGRNWIHIQDGTGDPIKNSHDLVVTSSELAEVEEVVVVEGRLAAQKDFGFGYAYDALIEQAQLLNE